MLRKLDKTHRYCCQCRGSTVWELDGNKYRCIGDNNKHPERKIHGCGSEVDATRFISSHAGAVKNR